MKNLIVILIVLSFSLNACKEKETIFLSESPYYRFPNEKYILVENAPKDRNKLKQLVLENWIQTLDFPIDSFRIQTDIDFFSVSYIKSVYVTRQFFDYEDKSHRDYENWHNYKTILGKIWIYKCNNNNNVKLSIRTLPIDPKKYDDPIMKMEEDILLNECDSTWYESNKDNTLVKYFMDSQEKKNKIQ